MNIKLNTQCVCIKGKPNTFTKGKKYQVNWFYQLPDGDFMVEVVDDLKLTVQAKADRFLIDFKG